MSEPMQDEAATVGPRCGNNPNVRLTAGGGRAAGAVPSRRRERGGYR
jgi:hypothetical protein